MVACNGRRTTQKLDDWMSPKNTSKIHIAFERQHNSAFRHPEFEFVPTIPSHLSGPHPLQLKNGPSEEKVGADAGGSMDFVPDVTRKFATCIHSGRSLTLMAAGLGHM
jgi:hypothetical protein